MFKVLKIDGPNLVTDKGCVALAPFQYADGGQSRPVGAADWAAMRTLFVEAPAMLAALEKIMAAAERIVAGLGSAAPDLKLSVADIFATASAAVARAAGK